MLMVYQSRRQQKKLCHSRYRPTALPVGVSWFMPPLGGITPLTCTIFDPSIFGNSQRNQVFHISPTRPKWPYMGNYLDTFLKMAHRGNTGFRRGNRMLLCVSVKLIRAFFSLFRRTQPCAPVHLRYRGTDDSWQEP